MIYVHVPFCGSFCTYCDFYSEIVRPDGCVAAYVDGILDEASRRRDEIEAARTVNTLYIGGGTPSVLPLDVLKTMVGALGGGPYEEFTVEVNPEDIVEKGEGYAEGLLALGVNRVSMGVQSLDDGLLRWMNRRHDAARAIEAFRILRRAGVANISVDLIFGISHQDAPMLAATLDGLLELAPEHISAYQLSVEEGSALGKMLRDGSYAEASDEHCAAQYAQICGTLAGAGYHHYEISNWARPGREAVHNSAYWTGAPYVGLGPGAHSFDGNRTRSWNSRELRGWSSESEILTDEDLRVERIMLGLRTDRGIDPSGLPEAEVSRMLREGILEHRDNHLKISEKDWFVSDSVIRDLL